MGGVIASFVSALALASPAQAIGLTFNWSFNADTTRGAAIGTGTVSGTISGVQDNATTTSGLIATVLSTPDGQNQGRIFSSSFGDGITVAGGVVTSAGLGFSGSDINSDDFLFLGSGSFFPTYSANSSYALVGGSTTFSSATPVPFDFDPSFGVVALGGIWAGRKVIKKIKTSKQSV